MKTLKIFLTNKMHELKICKFLKTTLIVSVFFFFGYLISSIVGYLGLKFLSQSTLAFLNINTTIKVFVGLKLIATVITAICFLFIICLIFFALYNLIIYSKEMIKKTKEFMKDNWLYAKILSGEEERFILIKERKIRSNSYPLIVKKYSNSDYYLMGVDSYEEVDGSAHRNFTYETGTPFSNQSTIKIDLLCMLTKEEVELVHKFYPDFIRIRATKEFLEEAGVFYQKTVKRR